MFDHHTQAALPVLTNKTATSYGLHGTFPKTQKVTEK